MIGYMEFKTGDAVPQPGTYRFVRYADGGPAYPRPDEREAMVYLKQNDQFPIIRSSNRKAVWQIA